MTTESNESMELETVESGTWWSRPFGGRDVWRVALPLIISMGSFSLMNFVDRAFLARFDPDAMAAALPSGVFYFTMLCLPLGIIGYANTFVAQYYGAKRPEKVGVAVGQAFKIGLLLGPFYLLFIPAAPYIFDFFQHDPRLAQFETTYLQWLCVGAGGILICESFSAYFTGRGRSRPVMVITVTAVCVNICLDWVMIFGHFGFPEMGVGGAALATALSQWLRAFLFIIWMRLETTTWHRYKLWHGFWTFDRALFRRLLRYGGPNGLQLFVEVGGFTLFTLLVGQLGRVEMTATTLAFTINNMAFLPLLGISIAVSSLVGQGIGRDRPDLAARATWTASIMAFAYMGLMTVLYLSIPKILFMAHAPKDSEELALVIPTAIVLMRFVAAYSLLDAANMVFAAALKGAGDTRFVLGVTAIMSTCLPLGVWASINHFQWGLYGAWSFVTLWVCSLGIIYWLRFLQGRWRHMKVIEPEAAAVSAYLSEEGRNLPI